MLYWHIYASHSLNELTGRIYSMKLTTYPGLSSPLEYSCYSTRMVKIKSTKWHCLVWRKLLLYLLNCFTLLLARHLVDVSCFIGPSMPSGICMEIHTKIVQKGRRNSHMVREYLGNPKSIHKLTNHISVNINQSQTLIKNILKGQQWT